MRNQYRRITKARFCPEKISEIQEIYRYIFLKGLNNSKALDIVEKEVTPSTERDYIVTSFAVPNAGL